MLSSSFKGNILALNLFRSGFIQTVAKEDMGISQNINFFF